MSTLEHIHGRGAGGHDVRDRRARNRPEAATGRPRPAPLLCQALPARSSSVSALSRWTTTSDRAEPDELLHRAGGPPVDCADAHSKGRRCCRFDRRRSSGRGVRGACVGALTGSSSKRPTVAVRHRSNSQLQGSTRRLPVAATATHRSAGRLLRSQIDSDLGPATGTERDCFRTNVATRLRASMPAQLRTQVSTRPASAALQVATSGEDLERGCAPARR